VVLLDAVMMIISAAVLSTLRMLRNIFRPLELMVYGMVIIVAIEQIHSAVIDNFKLIEYSRNLAALSFYKMNQLIVIPILTLWLLYSFFSPRIHFLLKAIFVGLWLLGLSGAYQLFHYLGIFKLNGLHMGYSAIIWLTVLAESVCFVLWFRRLLRRRDDRDSAPARTI
jgi:hypothetical protein